MFLYFVQNLSILTQITFFFSSNGHIEPDFYYFSLKTEFIWSIGPQIFSLLPPIIFIFLSTAENGLFFSICFKFSRFWHHLPSFSQPTTIYYLIFSLQIGLLH